MKNIQIGSKVRQIAIMEDYGFNYVGEEFKSTERISESVYKFMGVTVGVGFCATLNELDKYFEIIEEELESAKVEDKIIIHDGVKCIQVKNKTIVILEDKTKAITECCFDDTYDAQRGYDIAYRKAILKSINKEYKRVLKELRKLTK